MDTPHGQQVRGVATAHVDHILPSDERRKIGDRAPEEREHGGVGPIRERGAEAFDVPLGVATRGGHEADAGPLLAREGEDVVIEKRVVRLHAEAPAAHGNDGRLSHRFPCACVKERTTVA